MLDTKRMRELAAAATPGPWESEWDNDDVKSDDVCDDDSIVTGPNKALVVGSVYYDGKHAACNRENASFIAEARAFVPLACDRIEELEAALREIAARKYCDVVECTSCVEKIALAALEGGGT